MKNSIRFFSLQVSITIALFITSCVPFPTGGGGKDSKAPTVTSTNPVDGAVGIAVNTAITATFSEKMNGSTINESTFTLQNADGEITGTVSYSGKTATFTPFAELDYYTLYTATITTAVNDTSGNELETDYIWIFTTGIEPDITAPTVTSTDPVNGANGIAINSEISVTFSEEMNAATINDTSFILQDAEVQIEGNVSYAGTTATFTPTADLNYDTPYTAMIKTAATDASGNAMASDYVWSFTTGQEPDNAAPVPGNSGILTVSDIGQTSLRLSWVKAIDNVTTESELQYRVYFSADNNIGSAEEAETNGTPVNQYSTSIEEVIIADLQIATTYYFNVIVKDSANNKAAYTAISASTLQNRSKGILLVSYDQSSANSLETAMIDLDYLYEKVPDTDPVAGFRSHTVNSLMEYSAVFYIGVPTAESITLLTAYLNAGGSLYISDNDLGYRYRLQPFYQIYLQAIYDADNGGDLLTGEGIMGGIDLDITGDPYPDAFTAGSEGECVFKFTGTSYAGGIAVSRNGYKAIYTSFDFRYIQDYEDTVSLTEKIADYLCGEYL